jgi:hypothetical protein
LAVVALLGSEPTAVGGGSQGAFGKALIGEGGEGHEPLGAGDGGHHEAVEVVEDCSGEEFAERSRVAGVGRSKAAEVLLSVPQEDDRWGVAEAEEKEIEEEASGASIAVEEGVDPLEFAVGHRQRFDRA